MTRFHPGRPSGLLLGLCLLSSTGLAQTPTWSGTPTRSGQRIHRVQQAYPTARNQGLAASQFLLDGANLYVSVNEADQGGLDLNGDGDALDDVVHVRAGENGPLVNLGLASALIQAEDGFLAIEVPEADQGGTDFNGDGDSLDTVMHVHDMNTGVTTNLGRAIYWRAVGADHLAWSVPETDQGNTDLNGDGDVQSGDRVVHVVDRATLTVTNLMLAGGTTIRQGGDLLALDVLEARQGGVDLNGDGDTSDRVMHLHRLSTGATTNLARSIAPGSWVAFGPDRVSFSVNDVPGSGGYIVVDHDASTGITTELQRGSQPVEYIGSNDLFVWSYESVSGDDYNGDGDTADTALVEVDLSSLVHASSGVASDGFAVSGDRALIGVKEFDHGATDLNGDGDTGDSVLHLRDAANGTTTNLGLALYFGWMRIEGDFAACLVRESGQGGTDLNGDGDALDLILHVIDPGQGTTASLQRACRDLRVGQEFTIYTIDEAADGNRDLNQDGDSTDQVIGLFDARLMKGFNLKVAFDPLSPLLAAGRRAAFRVSEADHGGVDLNGDGDALDLVLHTVRLKD